MSQASEQIAKQFANGNVNKSTWGNLLSNVKVNGAKGDGVADDTTAIQDAINANSMVGVPSGKYKVSSLSNPFGNFFLGSGLVYSDDGTNRVAINSFADQHQHVFGREYLSAFHKKLLAGNATTIVFSGDSTTFGAGVSAGYTVDGLIKEYIAKDGLTDVTLSNRGQSGADTEQWVNTYLAGDLAANPDLLVLRWGINDPGYDKSGNIAAAGATGDATRRTVDDFKNSLRSGLATIRTSKTLSRLSIVLMSPNSTYDTPNRRDSLWYEQINGVIRQAARDYQCVFIDTYAQFQDSVNGTDYMDAPYGDQRHVHPADVMNVWITSTLYDVIMPNGMKKRLDGGFANIQSLYGNHAAADLPNTYKSGFSMYRAFTGWPYDGMVATMYQNDGIILQFNTGYDTSKAEFAFRIGYISTNTWSAWATAGGGNAAPLPASIAPTLQNGWVNFDPVSYTPAGYYKDAQGIVHLEGLIKSGTTTAGTVLFTLPEGYRSSKGRTFPVASASAFGAVFLDALGNVKFSAGSSADFSLDGISFPAR